MALSATPIHGWQVYEHEKKKHRETDELRREEAALQQETQRLRQVLLDFWLRHSHSRFTLM